MSIAPGRWIASCAVGAHGLPLMGTGDWNDGMNRVGEQGKGESVWLGWFLFATARNSLPREKTQRHDAWRRWLVQRTLRQPRFKITAGMALVSPRLF